MNTTLSLFASGSSRAWIDLVLVLSLKATMVLCLAAVTALLLRRSSAAARHLVWSAAMVGLLALVPLSMWGPSWRVHGVALPSLGDKIPVAVTSAESEAAGSTTPRPHTETPSSKAAAPLEEPTNVPPRMLTTILEAGDAARPARSEPWDWTGALVALWVGGALVCLGGLVAGAIGLARMASAARPMADAEWVELLEECSRRIGLRRPVTLLAGDGLMVPCTWGAVRPCVLVPTAALDWPRERRRVVLLHELAHVARHDCLVQVLAQLACGLFWFHPLAWWAARQLRTERELACDDLVLRSDTRASDYADHLLAVVRSMREPRLPAIGAVAFARRSQFEGRLLAVLDPSRVRGILSARWALPAIAAAALVVLPLAALRSWVEPARAGNVTFNGERLRPEDAPASEVVRAPEGGTLSDRLSWAFDEANRRGLGPGFWVAYRIDRPTGSESNMGDSGPINIGTLSGNWTGLRLSDVLAGRDRRGPKSADARNSLVLAFHFPRRSTSAEAIDRIRFQTDDLPASFGRQTLIWLGEVEDPQSFEWLRTVEDEGGDDQIRSMAVQTLAQHGNEGVREHLAEVLQSGASNSVRATAAEELFRFEDGATLTLLTKTIRDERSTEVREAAIEALAHMKSEEGTRLLSELARSKRESPEVRRAAIEALGEKAGHVAEETLGDLALDESQPDESFDEDSRANGVFERKKMTKLETKVSHQQVQKERAQEAREQDQEARERAQQAREDGRKYKEHRADGWIEREEVQRQAVEALGQLPEDKSLPRLLNIARTHQNERVRRAAIEALGSMESPRAREALKEFAWQSSDPDVARQAVEELDDSENPEAMIEIARRHSHPDVRRQAIESLGQVGPKPQVLEALDDLIWSDDDEAVQRAGVEALSEMPEKVSLPLLEKIARKHPNVLVRRNAIEALSEGDPEKVTPILESLIKDKDDR